MKEKLSTLYAKDGTKKLISSLISILVGLLVGGIVVAIVGVFNSKISGAGIWDGIRLIFAGILNTGRDASGALTWGFNPQNIGNMLFRATPLIMTGLSVAIAFKTGLFNIGAPGQYLMGTLATLYIALGIPSSSVPAGVIWLLAFLGGMLAGALAGAGAALYWLSGNTEFYWTTYQSLPGVGFNGIPVALLAVNNPIAVIFTGIFMAMLDIVGMQLTNLTAYNEYITDVIISVIVYLSAFSLVIRMMLTGRKKRKAVEAAAHPTTAPVPPEAAAQPLDTEPSPEPNVDTEKGGEEA